MATNTAYARLNVEIGPVVVGDRFQDERIQNLESLVMQMNQRLIEVENRVFSLPGIPGGGYPGHPGHGGGFRPSEISCLLIDSGYSKVFFAKGRTSLEAEANVRSECGQSVHSSYCTGSIKCSDSSQERRINGAICILKDTGYSKIFKGEASTLLEAEYKARKACGDTVHSSYCKSDIRCDVY